MRSPSALWVLIAAAILILAWLGVWLLWWSITMLGTL